MDNPHQNLNVVTHEQAITVIEDDDDFSLDLVLRKGEANTRVVSGIALQYEGDNELVNEIKYQAEFPQIDMDAWAEETAGMNQNDIVRKYAVCIWDWPLANGKRTTREQFSRAMLNKLLTETYISTSLLMHLIAVRDGGKIKDLHRQLRKGN